MNDVTTEEGETQRLFMREGTDQTRNNPGFSNSPPKSGFNIFPSGGRIQRHPVTLSEKMGRFCSTLTPATITVLVVMFVFVLYVLKSCFAYPSLSQLQPQQSGGILIVGRDQRRDASQFRETAKSALTALTYNAEHHTSENSEGAGETTRHILHDPRVAAQAADMKNTMIGSSGKMDTVLGIIDTEISHAAISGKYETRMYWNKESAVWCGAPDLYQLELQGKDYTEHEVMAELKNAGYQVSQHEVIGPNCPKYTFHTLRIRWDKNSQLLGKIGRSHRGSLKR